MLADTTGAFTKALGMDHDLSAALGSVRCEENISCPKLTNKSVMVRFAP